ncbi:MAG: ABC transporter substrate-binding protein [Spirochaetaceae bacterium]|nr:ABC transporter substrate-binding protein [Spirochaetaceae bacterium]MCF7948854.1 ABC transporter substrate-binding protein [Spirochaetia bacterium]MCF7952076.1 ABC transporter substrate-binding protein [Spirochaetaceae bacterium]
MSFEVRTLLKKGVLCCSFLLLIVGNLQPLSAISAEYAEGFSIEELSGVTLLNVHPPESEHYNSITYALVGRDKLQNITPDQLRKRFSIEPKGSELYIIRTPVKHLIPLSTTFLPPLLWLNLDAVLSGIDNVDYIYSRKLRDIINRRNIPQVGNGPSLDMEQIVQLQPAVVMANITQGEWNVVPKLRDASIPVVLNGDYLETTPLGRAEWIKFIGLLCGKGKEAENQFNAIVERYTGLQQMVQAELSGNTERPKVIMNRPMNGRWVVPGGSGYMAQFIEDAGGHYLWSSDTHSRSLVLDAEAVYIKARQADVWLHQYGSSTLQELLQTDPRLRRLNAFQTQQVINNDARTNKAGSNNFYESGPYQPDLILADLISLFHPSLLPGHSLYYYRFLE